MLTKMDRKRRWLKVLDSEMRSWSALPYGQLVSRLSTMDAYEVEHESKKYQVEIDLSENTAEYVHITVSVDDGSLPASVLPATDSFIRKKSTPGTR